MKRIEYQVPRKKIILVFHEFEKVTSCMHGFGLGMRVNSVSHFKEICFSYI